MLRCLAVLFLGFLLGNDSLGQVLDSRVITRDLENAPAGYVSHDLVIDFQGRLFGQQLVVSLQSGSLYQDPFGGDTAPNPNLFSIVPAVAADTFLTLGGADESQSYATLVVGGSTELGLNTLKQVDEEGINVAWAPSPGVEVSSGDDFMVARLTLSTDATGTLWYFGNANGEGRVFGPLPFREGFFPLETHVPVYPEPGSSGLAALAAFVLFAAGKRVRFRITDGHTSTSRSNDARLPVVLLRPANTQLR